MAHEKVGRRVGREGERIRERLVPCSYQASLSFFRSAPQLTERVEETKLLLKSAPVCWPVQIV